jgi:hypothetical protein
MKLLKKMMIVLMLPIGAYAQDSAPFIVENVNNPTCFGSADGMIVLTDLSGNEPTDFTFLWNNGSTQHKISNLYGGTYTCVITDKLGQVYSKSIRLERPSPLSIGVSTCHFTGEESLGSVCANVTGGTGEHRYFWSNGEMTSVLSDLSPGEYTLVVADANNCELDIVVEIKDKEDKNTVSPLTTTY